MALHSEVLSDLTQLRSQLRARGNQHVALLQLSPWRPLLDIAIDWAIILASVAVVVSVNSWWAPLAVCVIANRQRALGNILHDAGHRNLWRDRFRNDWTARLLVAPLLFASLSCYRQTHFRHHLSLGDARADPDILPVPDRLPSHWVRSYAEHLCAWPAWRGSVVGHLAAATGVRLTSRLYIVFWWLVALAVLGLLTGFVFTTTFVVLWLLARATVFHLITTLREMCDHFGLQPGGVFSFTRDMACHGLWRRIIHPRNNGYHLTHHLLPAIPYYRLPQAHELFCHVPAFCARAQVCQTYFRGDRAVVNAWQLGDGQP